MRPKALCVSIIAGAALVCAAPTAVASQKTECIKAHGRYAGLGVTVAAFKAENHTAQPENPTFGDIAYTILKTTGGCVTAFRVDIWTKPNPTGQEAAETIFPELRDAAAPIISKRLPSGGVGSMYCDVWSSRSLKKLTGDRYAVAIGEYPGIGDNASAEITAWTHPNCNVPGRAFGNSDAAF